MHNHIPKILPICLLLWLMVSCIAPPPAADRPLLAGTGNYASPDRRWQAAVVMQPCVRPSESQSDCEALNLYRVGDRAVQLVDEQTRYTGGLGAYGLAGLFWSANSQYFYYTDGREGGPDGCGFWERPIRRVDTTTLQTQAIGNGRLSPDGTKIITWQHNEFFIWKVDGGEAAHQPLLVPEAQLVGYAWSPDSQALIYLQIASTCPTRAPSQLIRIDLAGMQQQSLFANHPSLFQGLSWEEPGQIRLVDGFDQQWHFDLARGQLISGKRR